MANNQFESIIIATELSDAMIERIKEKKLIERIALLGENLKAFHDTIIGLFSLKYCSLLLEYAQTNEELKKEIETSAEDLEDFKMLKDLLNIKGEG